jgi:hypothetical protein
VLDHDIVLPEGAPQLVATLQERGYRCYELPMSEFLKAGGACKCLTMFLPQREKVAYATFRFAPSAGSIFPRGKQFITSVLVSQPLRAMPMPNHKS